MSRRRTARVVDVAAQVFGAVALLIFGAVPFIFWLGGAR